MKVGRNDPCPCGSGKKFKKCCMGQERRPDILPPAAAQDRRVLPPPTPPRPAPIVAKPPKPPSPPDPVREEWDRFWQEFKAETPEGRIAMYLRTLEDDERMDDEVAFEMLNQLCQDSVEQGDRQRFAKLVGALADRRPEVYQQGAHHYLSWQVQAALVDNRTDELLPLVRELAGRARDDIDIVHLSLRVLAYHGQLAALVEAMRIGWPLVRSSDNVMAWATSNFANEGCMYEIYTHVMSTPVADPHDSDLLSRIKFFFPDPRLEFIENFIADLTGRTASTWKADDFHLRPPRKNNKRRDEWDDDDEQEREQSPDPAALNLARLITEFVGYMHREEGVPYTKGELVRDKIHEYFLERRDGKLNPRPSMLERALEPNKKLPLPPKPDHPLCMERVTFEVYLAQMLGFLNSQHHRAAALFEVVPAWLRFLESRGLIDADRRTKTVEELRPLHAHLLKLMESYKDDPALYQALKNWPDLPDRPTASSEGQIGDGGFSSSI